MSEPQISKPQHVLIIGGGIGGLTLAQGLKRAGVSAAVYERDRTLTDRLQGYRVHISPTGSLALHECLPPHLFEVFARTCGAPNTAVRFFTEQMRVLLAFDGELVASLDPVARHRAASRITLRQVLLAELDNVHFGKTFERYEQRGGRVNLVVSVLTYFHTPILHERHLTGVRMATLLGFALVIVEILSDRRAQALLIATAVALFVSFILTEKPKASWREPAAYVIKNTRCDRREILVYSQTLPPWLLSYYLSDERFVLKGSPFDSGVVQELGRLNETRPGCDVVAIALNADREAALAATPFRGPGFHLQEWPSSFVVRRINP